MNSLKFAMFTASAFGLKNVVYIYFYLVVIDLHSLDLSVKKGMVLCVGLCLGFEELWKN